MTQYDQKRKESEDYFNRLSKMIGIAKNVKQGNALLAENMIPKCDELIRVLKTYTQYECFRDIVKENMTEKYKNDSIVGFAWVEPLNAYFPTNNADYVDSMIRCLIADVEKYKKQWKNCMRLGNNPPKQAPWLVPLVAPYLPQERDAPFAILPDCVVTDVETTGLSSATDSIIEIAAIKIIDGRIQDNYTSLIRTGVPLSSQITSLTGITDEMLNTQGCALSDVMAEYEDFIGNLPLVGHNIKSFDINFINAAMHRCGREQLYNTRVDTLAMSRECLPDLPSHKLADLARHAHVSAGTAHHALDDCETTLNVYKYLVSVADVSILTWSKNAKEYTGNDNIYPRYIKRYYPESLCHDYHERLIMCGYLEPAPPRELLKSSYKVENLKRILSEHSLPTNGNKDALVDRVLENTDISKLNLPFVYSVSKSGQAHIANYL